MNYIDWQNQLCKLLKYERLELTFNDLLIEQNQKVTQLYLLETGQVEYLFECETDQLECLVSVDSESGIILGWNALIEPYRATNSIRVKSKTAHFLVFNVDDFERLVTDKPKLLIGIGHVMACLHRDIVERLFSFPPAAPLNSLNKIARYQINEYESPDKLARFLRRSPFLEYFDDEELKELARLSEYEEYEESQAILSQDEKAGGFFILLSGEVSLRRNRLDQTISIRNISTPSFIFGWSALVDFPDVSSIIAVRRTEVLYVSNRKLTQLFKINPSFHVRFRRRLLWLIRNQVQSSQILLQRIRVNHDDETVEQLINNNRPKLSIASPLHQIPHLLRDRSTIPLAFKSLHQLNHRGDSIERHLASLSLDMLKLGQRENLFMQNLNELYQQVTERDSEGVLEIRRRSAQAVKKLFKHTNYTITGWQNLPDSPGHIFVYNHLLNDPYYTLPNSFQITLDSHFISSLVLDEKYGDPGTRVVRIGDGPEYGHQKYYERLGFINVSVTANTSERRKWFYEQGGKVLSNGQNLIISPEGNSQTTENSPGQFKMGAFKLATLQIKEPLIVPLVMCHFDKRVTHSRLRCHIMEPFKISQRMADSNISLDQLVSDLQDQIRTELTNARHLEAEPA